MSQPREFPEIHRPEVNQCAFDQVVNALGWHLVTTKFMK
jgi:hypothetical protein